MLQAQKTEAAFTGCLKQMQVSTRCYRAATCCTLVSLSRMMCTRIDIVNKLTKKWNAPVSEWYLLLVSQLLIIKGDLLYFWICDHRDDRFMCRLAVSSLVHILSVFLSLCLSNVSYCTQTFVWRIHLSYECASILTLFVSCVGKSRFGKTPVGFLCWWFNPEIW